MIVLQTKITLQEKREANGAAAVREALDAGFESAQDWVKTSSGGIDWIKRIRYNASFLARLGVEIQVSARSDLLVRDFVHIRNSLQEGEIDSGVIIVPSDTLQTFLTDRTPCLSDAIKYCETEFPEASKSPIAIMAIEHDGSGPALPKKVTNRAKSKANEARSLDMGSVPHEA